jgi:hypothetical protein
MVEKGSDFNKHWYIIYAEYQNKYLLSRFTPIALCGLNLVVAAFCLTTRLIISAYKFNLPSAE